MKKAQDLRARRGRALSVVLLCLLSAGCVPDDTIRQVLGENIVFTSAVVIQTITASIFNSFFSLFGVV